MKKDWKDIEGQLVRIDIGSTYNEAQSNSTDAGIICFTTDGHIVLNGMDYVVDTDAFKGKVDDDSTYMNVKHSALWCMTYILQGDASHPFLQGRLTEDTYNIGWMLDGYTYNESVKIPLISEEQQGLVDAQAYTDYIQPLLKGEYDDSIDALKDSVKKAQETADRKVDDDSTYMNVKHSALWCMTYVLGDHTGSEHPFLRYRVDEESMTLKLGNMMDGWNYAENVSIPLIDDTNGVFFDPYYYREYIQPLFNDEYALLTDIDEKVKGKVDKEEGKGLSTNDFTDFYKVKLDSISGNANRYVLPAATKDELGGVKVGGDVRDSASSLPLEGAVISREMDGTILVPYASASSHGASYDKSGAMSKAQVRKLYEIEAKAQVNKIEGIRVNGVLMSVGEDKVVDIIVSGGGGTGDAETINALMVKVQQMQAEIEELKNKLCLTYE